MAKLTIEQDMKLGTAMDQLEDAIEAVYASLKMLEWAQINVARFAGSVVAPELNATIRALPVDVEKLWSLARLKGLKTSDEHDALFGFIEQYNHSIIDIVIEHSS